MSDKNIPLSELIRIGSKLTGQCSSKLYDPLANATCAIGAAYLAKTGEFPEPCTTDECLRACGYDVETRVQNPQAAFEKCSLKGAIVYLNDKRYWTREAIADWLEELGL